MSRPVVSAEDVRAARRRGELRLAIPSAAIVTPLAREEAARWGIDLAEGDPARAASGATPVATGRVEPARRIEREPHRATCDPGDVDRVAERVLARVPLADPALVREIARRVLEDGAS